MKLIFNYPFNHEPWLHAWTELKDFIINKTFATKFKKAVTQPFVIVDDEESKCKRVFLSKEDADIWFQARADQAMTSEIAKLEFTGNTIPGVEQFQLTVNILNNPAYAKVGSTGNVIQFDFATIDKIANSVVGESVDVYFTFNNSGGTRQTSEVFSYKQGQTINYNVDSFLMQGTNVITLLVRGRTTGIQKVISMSYTLVKLDIETSFKIEQAIDPNTKFNIVGRVRGDYARSVHYYIDENEVAIENISAIETDKVFNYEYDNTGGTLAPGSHVLQIKAFMTVGGQTFKSNLLYREFEIKGKDETRVLISVDFPDYQEPFKANCPGLSCKQFVTKTLNWAYYSSYVELQHADVVWRLYNEEGAEIAIGSRQADVVEGEIDKLPDPLKFMPTDYGDYLLQPLVNGEVLQSYTISVERNEELYEPTTGLTMKLSGLGRSNDEPIETRKSWSYKNLYCEFHNFNFDASSGYNDDAVCFVDGAYGIIKSTVDENGNYNSNPKPLSVEVAPTSKNGAVIEFDFESYNVDEEDCLIAYIGNPDGTGTGIFIYPNKAILRNSLTEETVIRFKTNERTKIAFIISPDSSELTSTPRFTFAQVNGVKAFPKMYEITANYNVGTSTNDNEYGLIHIGNPEGKAGIKIYCIRTYDIVINTQGLLNNYIIDKGVDLEKAIKQNNIFVPGTTDVNVDILQGMIPVCRFTGDMSSMIGSAGKPEIDVAFEFTHPDYYDLYKICNKARAKKSGQSTQDFKVPPSIHVKFNKNKDNKLFDRDGNQYPKNRAPLLPGMTPENSFRLLNNILDSSNVNGGGSLNFLNDIYRNTQLRTYNDDGQVTSANYILRSPIQEYVYSGKYAQAISRKTGRPIEKCQFPYTVNFTPAAFPCVAVWRATENDPYQFLGIYTACEEKKAFYANGGHSIRDKVMGDGTLDPYDIYEGEKGEILYDNTGFLQFEIVTKSPVTLLTPTAEVVWNNVKERETAWEKISEHDNETDTQNAQDWKTFGEEVIFPLCKTYGNQAEFDKIIWKVFDKYNVVAFYIIMLVFCGTDSSFRNEQFVKFCLGQKWRLKEWDFDMLLGLLQDTYALDAPTMADLHTKVNGKYIFNGIGDVSKQDSFWLWEGCLGNKEFIDAIPVVYQAMYEAGFKKKNIIEAFDKFYRAYSPALYNIDTEIKYLTPYFSLGEHYFISAQGDRSSHRHYFIDTNVDFFEQKWGVGDFINIRTYTRAGGNTNGCKVYLKAGSTGYFGDAISGVRLNPEEEIYKEKGESFYMVINRDLTAKDPYQLLSPHKLEEIDLHEIARFFSGGQEFNDCYNDIIKTSLLKKLIIGMTKEDIKRYGPNLSNDYSISGIGPNEKGEGGAVRLEVLSVNGMNGLKSLDLSVTKNLKEFYAINSGLTSFHPADSTKFNEVELSTIIRSVITVDVKLPSYGIKFIDATSDNTDEFIVPNVLLDLNLVGMGDDPGTHVFIHNWLEMIRRESIKDPNIINNAHIIYKGINWTDASKEDILTLAKIPMKTLTGYIKCNEVYTQEDRTLLMKEFGDNVFNYKFSTITLVCDGEGEYDGISISVFGNKVSVDKDGIINIVQGYPVTFRGAGFPIANSSQVNYRWGYNFTGPDDDFHFANNDNYPEDIFGTNNEYVLNYKTGEFFVKEFTNNVIDIYIRCKDIITFYGGTIHIKIIPRKYPTESNISLTEVIASDNPIVVGNQLQITDVGSYIFTANHIRKENGISVAYDGTLKDVEHWSTSIVNNTYFERNNNFETNSAVNYCLHVKELPDDEIAMQLKYTGHWNNGVNKSAPAYNIAFMKVIKQLLINDPSDGNPPLFAAFVAAGIEHKYAAYYSSLEVKNYLNSVFDINSLLDNPSSVRTFYTANSFLPKYMKNTNVFNFSNASVTETFDLTKTPWATEVNLENTNANIKL